MKVFVRFLSVSIVGVLLAGCASDVAYVPQIPPHAQAKLLDYYEQPDNKVFVIAIDPGGDYAFGYDYGKPPSGKPPRLRLKNAMPAARAAAS